MIRQVRLQNFKSWQETGSVRLAPLTCFFGTNSSGKSSLLQMLLLLKQTKESSDRSLILRTDWDNNAYINMGTIQELLHRSGQTTSHSMRFELIWDAAKPIVIRPDWKLEALQFSTEIVDEPSVMVGRFAYSGENFLAEMSLSDPIKKKYALKVLLNGEEPLVPQGRPRVHIGEPIKFYGFSDEALRVYANSGYLSDLVLSLETLLSSIYHLGPLRAYPNNQR